MPTTESVTATAQSPAPDSNHQPLRAVARRILGNDAVRIAAVVAIFVWLPLQLVIWNYVSRSDYWWQLRTGEWIVQHHQVPRVDPFSYTDAGKPWIDYSWPFQIAFYEVVNHWDLLGIVAVTIFNWMAMTLALFHFIRSFKPPFWASIVMAGICGVIVEQVMAPRPGALTVIFFILILESLCTARRTGNARRLWLVPVLIWLWANVHVQFVYGLFLIGVFCMEPIFRRVVSITGIGLEPQPHSVPARWMWSTLAVSCLATLVNPYGVGPYRVIVDFLHQPGLYGAVQETNAMAFDRQAHFLVVFVGLAAVYVLGRYQRVRPVWMVLLAWGALMSFKAERDLWVLTAISMGVIAERLGETSPDEKPVHPRVWLASAACVLLVLVLRFKTGPTNQELATLVNSGEPVGAVAYIHQHHLQGPIFNNFDWGGFLMYALPEMPVAIDDRTNVHGAEEIQRSMQTWSVLGDWYDDPLLRRANLVIAPQNQPLSYALAMDPHFKLVFRDRICMLYQRVLPPEPLPGQSAR